MARIPAKQYISQKLTSSKFELLYLVIENQHKYYKISDDTLGEAVEEIAAAYLQELIARATPEALKKAKKKAKGFMSTQIHNDYQSGYIGPEIAYMAKEILPEFINQNKTVENEA